MALIKCPECGNEISDKATKCPECGCILKEEEHVLKEEEKNLEESVTKKGVFKNKKVKIVSMIGVVVLVLIIVFFATGNLRSYYKAIGLLV